MRIEAPRTSVDKCVFAEDFSSRQAILSRGGVIVASSVQAGTSLRTDPVIDGNMETAGVANWLSFNCTRSKVAGTRPGGIGNQILEIVSTGGSTDCYQNTLTVGKLYRVTAWLKTDGTFVPRIYAGGATRAIGVLNSDWQFLDTGAFIATDAEVGMYAAVLVAGQTYYADDVVAETLSGGNGLSATGISGRVTYGGTEALLNNANKMTIALQFRTTSVALATNPYLVTKIPTGLNDNQFYCSLASSATGGRMFFSVAASASDLANSVISTNHLSLATEYKIHVVYDGTLAAASRVVIYANNTPMTLSITGTTPTSMRAGTKPITVFQLNGGINGAPPVDFILRSVRIYNEAWSVLQVNDDYLQQTYQKVFGGGA